MQNLIKKFVGVLSLVSCTPLFVSCGTIGPTKNSLKPVSQGETVYTFELKPAMEQKVIANYKSHSHVEIFEDQQILRERDEIVEFSAQEEVVALGMDGRSFTQRVKILKKDGAVELHTLGFPEEGEELETTLTTKAEVIKAGEYPKTSLFFVPPISLPAESVKVGETWTLDKEWVSMNNGIPLKLELVSVLKEVYQCGSDPIGCADIEISGSVKMMGVDDSKVNFNSEIRGRLFFALGRGILVWSSIKSQEKLVTEKQLLTVRGCMGSRLQSPEILSGLPLECEPVYDIPQVPGV